VLAVILCVGECDCIKDWARLTVVLNGLSLTVVQREAILSVADVMTARGASMAVCYW